MATGVVVVGTGVVADGTGTVAVDVRANVAVAPGCGVAVGLEVLVVVAKTDGLPPAVSTTRMTLIPPTSTMPQVA